MSSDDRLDAWTHSTPRNEGATHGWRGPHDWRHTGRWDHANGNTSLQFHCDCGTWARVARIRTEDADDVIGEYLGGTE